MNRFLLVVLLGAAASAGQAPLVPLPRPSQVLAFRRTAIMDTVTANLHGKVVRLEDRQPLPASVQLTNAAATFRARATPDGNFRFFHIPAGNYMLTATSPTCSPLRSAPVHLGTGDVAVTTIGLALLPAAKQ